ncbi:sigma factor-like helix-turn-helix DNA-binding protein [Fusobacterium periodonticum]|uniref:sigma factor-like helix-turn-helix DNA-binding protein n=1 Tax=Fusobacterium periodonticum TaxID=860 RepID=UPI00195B02E4|nr:sigma factor-like helix-turn-helix DNA-binding protein [Fusobacterium periodonticum]VTX73801.1 Sigma-70, region 4 [Fusobacterium periodonticum]
MATQEHKRNKYKDEKEIFEIYRKYSKRIKILLKRLNNPILIKGYSYDKLGTSGFQEVKSDIERISDLRSRIINDINRCEEFIYRVDSAIELLKDNKYYDVIKFRFIEGKTLEETAEELQVSTTTVNKAENELLKELRLHFKIQNFRYF